MEMKEGKVEKGIGMKKDDIMKMIEDMKGYRMKEEEGEEFWKEKRKMFEKELKKKVGIEELMSDLKKKSCVD